MKKTAKTDLRRLSPTSDSAGFLRFVRNHKRRQGSQTDFVDKRNNAETVNLQRDKYIAQIISDAKTPDYDKAIANCEDPSTYWSLSSLRRGLLGWLPLPRNCRILELGAGFGALTGGLLGVGASVDAVEWNEIRADALQRRYERSKRLRVLRQDLLSLEPEEPYDGIVLARTPKGFIGREDALWSQCARLLKNDGFLLAGFDNRFGLRYWRGGVDDRATVPFSAVDGGVKGLYSRAEFDAFALRAGLSPRRCFYPFPNAFFPLAIYTEREQPGRGLDDRLFTLDPWNSPTLLETGQSLYDALFREGLAPAMADYAMILYTASEDYATRDSLGAVDRVVLSADRGKKRSAVVRLYADGVVEKAPLYPEGATTLRRLYKTQEELRAKGLPVIEQDLLKNGVIRMPRRMESTLLEYLERLQDRDSLLAIYDQLERDILRSSPHVQTGDRAADVVLENGYIDMTPFNVFWVDGTPLYFDQEFVQPNCPAGYVLFRALRYAYWRVPELEQLAPLEEMKRRYLIEARWEEYEERERVFLKKTRRSDTLRQVYRWSEVDREAIERRRKTLLASRKIRREGYYPVGLLMGVFDMFHIGHLRLIQRAKEHCGYLRVAVLSDELVWKYKKKKPIIPLEERMQILAAVQGVDEVVCIEDTPSRLEEIKRRPFDCFFSGDDYRNNDYWKMEQKQLRKIGADIVYFPYTERQSSSKIRKKVKTEVQDKDKTTTE